MHVFLLTLVWYPVVLSLDPLVRIVNMRYRDIAAHEGGHGHMWPAGASDPWSDRLSYRLKDTVGIVYGG